MKLANQLDLPGISSGFMGRLPISGKLGQTPAQYNILSHGGVSARGALRDLPMQPRLTGNMLKGKNLGRYSGALSQATQTAAKPGGLSRLFGGKLGLGLAGLGAYGAYKTLLGPSPNQEYTAQTGGLPYLG